MATDNSKLPTHRRRALRIYSPYPVPRTLSGDGEDDIPDVRAEGYRPDHLGVCSSKQLGREHIDLVDLSEAGYARPHCHNSRIPDPLSIIILGLITGHLLPRWSNINTY